MYLDENISPVRLLKYSKYVLSGIVRHDYVPGAITTDMVEYDPVVHSSLCVVDGEALVGIWLEVVKNKFIFYISVKHVNATHKKCCGRLGALLTGCTKTYELPQCTGDWYSSYDNSFEPSEKTRLEVVNKQFSRESITQEHHTLLRPEEVLSGAYPKAKPHTINGKIMGIVIYGTNPRLKLSKYMIDKAKILGIATEAAIGTFLLYIHTAPMFAINLLTEIIVNSDGPLMFREQLKLEGIMSKQMQHYMRHDLNYIFELNVLVNRTDMKLNWSNEIINRNESSRTVDINLDFVKNTARRIFAEAKANGQKPQKKDWNHYWASRWATMPTGSFVSQYDSDLAYKKLIPGINNANKTTVLSAMKRFEFEKIINRTPEIYSSASLKYEWGKVRALYGCDITSYMLADFSMGDAEDCLPPYFPVSSSAKEDNVGRIISRMNSGIPICYDYDDFNTQHSLKSQRMVLEAWYDVYSHDLTNEQALACLWTINSVSRQYTKLPDRDVLCEVTSGLFSGWRHTAFMNTVLNRIYLEAAHITELTAYSIHNGDDVFATTYKFNDALKLIMNAEALGVRAQVDKMNVGTIAEFLRIDALADHPTGAQYLTRACTTAVHARIESEAATSLRGVLDATADRMESMIKRGGDVEVVCRLQVILENNWSRIFCTDISVIREYYSTHLIQGGCSSTAELKSTCLRPVPMAVENYEALALAKIIDIGSQDYLNYVGEVMKVPVEDIQRESIRKLNVAMAKGMKTTLEVVNESRRDIKVLRAVYRQHNRHVLKIHISKARLIGNYNVSVPTMDSIHFINWLSKQQNKQHYISVMT